MQRLVRIRIRSINPMPRDLLCKSDRQYKIAILFISLAVWYCSQECQRKVWPTHKLVCMQSRQQPAADDLHESRLHFNFAADDDVAGEEEGDDAEASYSGTDDDEDHYSGYKPAEFESNMDDLDLRLRHLRVNVSSGAGTPFFTPVVDIAICECYGLTLQPSRSAAVGHDGRHERLAVRWGLRVACRRTGGPRHTTCHPSLNQGRRGTSVFPVCGAWLGGWPAVFGHQPAQPT